MSPISFHQGAEPCGNKLLERLLPQGKFGNMGPVMHGCVEGVC